MSRLVIPSQLFDTLQKLLFKDDKESCVVLVGRAVVSNNELLRIVVREIIEPNNDSYDFRTSMGVQLTSHFIAEISQRAKKLGESLVFVHNHPFPLNEFSKTDDQGERVLASFFNHLTPNVIHASLLITPEVSIARVLGSQQYLKVIQVGDEFYLDRKTKETENVLLYDRQIRAFGHDGQKRLQSLRVGIVGVGGTGSIVAQQLAYLGVTNFLLIDPDTLEESNLNRVVGAIRQDIGEAKVDITKRLINQINLNATIKVVQDSVLKNSIAKLLIDTDFSFCCTDSHGSRAILNQLAYQYYVPIIDMGVVITVQNKKIEHIVARTQLLSPGLACMVCGNLLDYEEVRRDLLSDFERTSDPYILNEGQPAPAVISINSTIASMAVTMFLNSVVGIPGTARFINYNAITGISRPAHCTPHPTCVVCSESGSLGKADEWTLPARSD